MKKQQYVDLVVRYAESVWDSLYENQTTDVQVVYLEEYKGEEKLHYKHEGDSGFDLSAAIDKPITLEPFERRIIPSGVKMACPEGTEIQVRPRSGTAYKKGITVANTPGTVDAGYRGEIGIIVFNISNDEVTIEPGERIAQAVLCPVFRANFVEVEQLDVTTRGEGAYNSTGVK